MNIALPLPYNEDTETIAQYRRRMTEYNTQNYEIARTHIAKFMKAWLSRYNITINRFDDIKNIEYAKVSKLRRNYHYYGKYGPELCKQLNISYDFSYLNRYDMSFQYQRARISYDDMTQEINKFMRHVLSYTDYKLKYNKSTFTFE